MVQGDTHSFIVRIWHETEDDEGNIIVWRGSVDHVGSDKRLYFQDLDGMVRFIEEQVGSNDSRVPWWKSVLNRIRHAST